jgi:CheY-like chemotaxis protein
VTSEPPPCGVPSAADGVHPDAAEQVTSCSPSPCFGVREATALLENGLRFDVILSDVEIGDGDGLELQAAVRKSHPKQAERFVFMTGADSSGTVWFRKPFSLHAMRDALAGVVRRLGPARASSASFRAAPDRTSPPGT